MSISKNLYHSLNTNKVFTGHYNMVSLQYPKGKFLFNQTNKEEFWKLYSESIVNNNVYGVAEVPQEFTPLLIDVDLKSDSNKSLYSKEQVEGLVKIIQKILLQYVEHITEANVLCVVLEKAGYFNEKSVFKNGFHLHFPNCFLNRIEAIQDVIMPKIRQEITYTELFTDASVIDSIEKNPWLLYGSSKRQGYEPYLVSRVIDSNGVDISLEDGFKNYKIYDKYEDIINIKGNVSYYLPQILSIIPNNRSVFFLKENYKIPIINESSEDLSEDLSEETEEIATNYSEEEIDFIFTCFDYLDNKRYENYQNWWFCLNLALKLGLNNEQIHYLSEKADNYDKEGTDDLIKKYEQRDKYEIRCLYLMLMKDNPVFLQQNKKHHIFKQIKINKKYNPVELDYINPTELVNQSNIGSYIERLGNPKEKSSLLIRSNMGTYKTQRLKEIIPQYKRVLYITFRTSLAKDIEREFNEFGFNLYSDLNTDTYNQDKLIVQIDSISKVVGKFDLIVLDEFTYVLSHITNFSKLKDKQNVFRVLNDYIQTSTKVIVLDGLLDRFSVEYIKLLRTEDVNTIIVDNQYKKFARNVKLYQIGNKQNDYAVVINKIKDLLKEGKNVVVPTNSKSFGDKIYAVCSGDESIKIGYINSERDIIETTEWSNYNLLIYTPSIVAGNSFNDIHFDDRVSVFSNISCNAYMSAQMIFRVRNISNTEEYIYISNNNMCQHYPTTEKDIERCLNKRVDLLTKIGGNTIGQSGLYLKNSDNKFLKNKYYHLFKYNLLKENKSKTNFSNILVGCLMAHGISFQIEEDTKKGELTDEQKDKIETFVDEQIQDVLDSPILSEEEYEKINRQTKRKTQEQCCSIKNTRYRRVFNIEQPTIKAYKLTHKSPQLYINLCFFYNNKDYKDEINKEIEYLTQEYMKIQDDDFYSKNELVMNYNNIIKLVWCYRIIDMLGFKSCFDTETVLNTIPYEKMVKFIIDKGKFCDIVWNNNSNRKSIDFDMLEKFDAKEESKEQSNLKISIVKFFNTKLKNTLGYTLKNVSASRNIGYKKFGLVSSYKFEDVGISLKYNEKLMNQKLFLNWRKGIISEKRQRLIDIVKNEPKDIEFLRMIGADEGYYDEDDSN